MEVCFSYMNGKKVRKALDTTASVTAGVAGAGIRLGLRVIATILLVTITTGLLFACIFGYYVKTCLPEEELNVEPHDYQLNQSSTMFYQDSNGMYQELTTLYASENRIWVDYENIPQYLEYAAIAIEDKRFYEHKGVDWYRTVAAVGNMFLAMKNDFGGSTITQQLIKNVTGRDEGTVQRKILEIFSALELEETYEKWEIMEWYLNTIYLGEGCFGVQTAAQEYFGKDVWDLSLAECASLIGITNNPSKYDPFISEKNNRQRQETILFEMYDQGLISYADYTAAMAEEMQFTRSEDDVYEWETLTWYEEAVREQVIQDLMAEKGIDYANAESLLNTGGYQIYTCIDMDIQAVVDSVYQDTANLPQSYRTSSQQLQSACVIIDPLTGDVKALAGGVGEKTANLITNRATESTRPAGSSTKPLSVYGPGFEYGIITQSTEVDDSEEIELSGTWWYPRNSGGTYRGITTIRQGLISSLNTVAAQILDKLTPAVSFDYMVNKLGFTTLTEADCDDAPLSMGQYTNGVKVLEMAQAYGAFANDGVMCYARLYTHVTDSEGNIILDNPVESTTAFSANTAWNLADMMKAAARYGTGYEAYFPTTDMGGKTGTTSANMDRWFCGITSYYACAVWTGYDIPEAMYFNGNPASQIWKRIMEPIHADLEYKYFPTPSYGKPTGIFGDLEESPSPSPSESPSPSPPDSPSPSPSEPVSPSPSAPVSPSPDTASPTPTVSDAPTPTPTPDVPPEPTTPVDPATPPA